ncbi:hypothetical protein T265_00268 [Opisthorchis viverrini]|uniref:Uncharacterized protein n=1 Tax=Opisthorchis viverrini TaxID=6198 RepID=A0A075A408_OPIVI|nr:hypothetical protein T265_00268 [Opisthorchis viverrini]KER34096.1 hypothetical protein T265_00268 [Opisthorchis viverrini]
MFRPVEALSKERTNRTTADIEVKNRFHESAYVVRGLNPTYTSQLTLFRLGQPGSIPAVTLPSGGVTPGYRKGVTAERFFFADCVNEPCLPVTIGMPLPWSPSQKASDKQPERAPNKGRQKLDQQLSKRNWWKLRAKMEVVWCNRR